MNAASLLESPIGPLVMVVDGNGALRALTFHDTPPDDPPAGSTWDPNPCRQIEDQLRAYLDGTRRAFDVPLALDGTPFQLEVWNALLRIPHGETWTYGRLAQAIGRPTASRAVGLANGRNPIPIIVPCHRVIGTTGRLVGYGGGMDRKRWLLAHEGVGTLLL
jgi:methylated-DNA-[protein]-cysteine S-methyltransferase